VIYITFWLIMSYFLWQLKCHYGLEYRHVWLPFFATLNGCDPHYTELSTLTCEGFAPLYKYSSYSSPDMFSPHGFQFLNMPQMLTRKIPTIATWLISFQNYWCFTRSFMFSVLGWKQVCGFLPQPVIFWIMLLLLLLFSEAIRVKSEENVTFFFFFYQCF